VMYGGLMIRLHARAWMLWQRKHVWRSALVPHRVLSGIAFTMSRAEANGCAIFFCNGLKRLSFVCLFVCCIF
jgi:hypothetical protein